MVRLRLRSDAQMVHFWRYIQEVYGKRRGIVPSEALDKGSKSKLY